MMTEQQFNDFYRTEILPDIISTYESDGQMDKPARAEAWNNTVDAFIEDGVLPADAGNWEHHEQTGW